MKIVSKFTKNIISKLVRKLIQKQFGYDVDIQLNELYISVTDGKAHVHLNANAELDDKELVKILKNVGLD